MASRSSLPADGRIVCWFSCGVTSAAATKITLDTYPAADVRIVYCDTHSEHPDNERFRRECEKWFGHPIEVIGSEEYRDTWDVWERTRWLVGPAGARCTTELKKVLRNAYQRPDDQQVFGFDASEKRRIERFRANNPEVDLLTPLYDAGIDKVDAGRMVMRAGIELPMMYRLGYRNNNCVGCVKGQSGYWNKIRVDFPETFERMARLEREIGAAICKTYAGDGKRKRVFLDELDPRSGNYGAEPELACGLSCGVQDDPEQIALWEGNK
jgi:hypothetical protein